MADNVTLNTGSGGSVLATDDIGGVHYQIVKMTYGALDAQTIASSGNGTTDAGTQRVTISSDSTGVLSVDDNGGSLTVDGTVTANAGTGTFTVDGSGVTQPVSNAGLTEMAAAINVSSQMDVNIAASAATVTVDGSGVTQPVSGTVTANLSATDNAVLDQIEVNTSYGDNVGNGTAAGSLRVSIASDTTGVLSVDDNGGSLTVDGTVTANLSATDNTVLDNIDTQTSPGVSHYRNIDANAEAEIKGSAGTLFWLHAMNLTAAKAYLHVYDATAASVTPGTTTPNYTFALPTQGDTNGAGFTLSLGANGQAFANAITIVCTTTLDGSTGDPGTNGVILNAGYT